MFPLFNQTSPDCIQELTQINTVLKPKLAEQNQFTYQFLFMLAC